MRKIMLLVLTLLVVAGPPGRTATFHECAGVPTDLGGTTFAPSDVVQWDGAAVYTLFFCGLPLGLPPGTVVDAAFMDGVDSGKLVLGAFEANPKPWA